MGVTPSSSESADVKIIRQPTVYLVGRQVVDDAAVERFLEDHGCDWSTDTEVGGEQLEIGRAHV